MPRKHRVFALHITFVDDTFAVLQPTNYQSVTRFGIHILDTLLSIVVSRARHGSAHEHIKVHRESTEIFPAINCSKQRRSVLEVTPKSFFSVASSHCSSIFPVTCLALNFVV